MLAKRLKKLIKRRHQTNYEFASDMRIPIGTLNGLLYQNRQPNSVTLIKLRTKGINPNWLLSGEGNMYVNQPTIKEKIISWLSNR